MAKESDASDDGIENLGRAINAECKEIRIDRDNYDTHIDLEKAMESTSSTLQSLLECVSSKFSNSFYSALIGNIVTSIVQNRTTHLQLALGIFFRHSKVTLNHLHDYRVTCTYDEILRFKKSAAVNSAKDGYLEGVPRTNDALFQVVTDNYDAKMSSQNNKLMCHCLATILTKNGDFMKPKTTFHRLKKKDLSSTIEEANEAEITHYFGPKQPPMPSLPQSNLDETFIKMRKVSHAWAEEIDFNFFNDFISKKECPEYNGYCTRVNLDQGHTVRPSTKIIYVPRIDMTPANPTTMQTSIKQAKNLSAHHGQEFCVYTSDQQLYCISLAVIWNTPELSKDFYLRLGGMHLLMSYIGNMGRLMAGSGLKEGVDWKKVSTMCASTANVGGGTIASNIERWYNRFTF